MQTRKFFKFDPIKRMSSLFGGVANSIKVSFRQACASVAGVENSIRTQLGGLARHM